MKNFPLLLLAVSTVLGSCKDEDVSTRFNILTNEPWVLQTSIADVYTDNIFSYADTSYFLGNTDDIGRGETLTFHSNGEVVWESEQLLNPLKGTWELTPDETHVTTDLVVEISTAEGGRSLWIYPKSLILSVSEDSLILQDDRLVIQEVYTVSGQSTDGVDKKHASHSRVKKSYFTH